MADTIVPQRRDLSEDVDRRPRWMRWAEQNLQTGWRLVIRHARGDAWWERGVQRTTISYHRACEIERVLGTEPARATLPDLPEPSERKPVTPPPGLRTFPYTDAETGVTIRTTFAPEIVRDAVEIWCKGHPESGFYARSGLPYSTVYSWARQLGRTRTPRPTPEANAARGLSLVYHDAATGRAIGVRYPPSVVGRALALYREGQTCDEAAKTTGVPATALRNWCTRLGIRRRARRAPQDLVPS